MDNLLISGAVTLVVGVLTYILKIVISENRQLKMEKDRADKTREKALENGLTCLLRVKLIEYHSQYMSERSISRNGYENWTLMYKAYEDLGGNGMVKHMNEEIESLDIRS